MTGDGRGRLIHIMSIVKDQIVGFGTMAPDGEILFEIVFRRVRKFTRLDIISAGDHGPVTRDLKKIHRRPGKFHRRGTTGILACIRIRHCLTSSSSKEHQFVEFG